MRHGHDRSLNADPLPPKFGPGYFNFPAGVIDFAGISKIMTALILLVLSTFHFPDVLAGFPLDTGLGKCRMDQHYHNGDGLCHRDSDDSPLRPLHN